MPALLLAAAAAAAVGVNTTNNASLASATGRRRARLEITDCTPASAPVRNVRWTAPSEVHAGEDVHVTASADLLESLTRPTYNVVVRYLGLPVMTRDGVACGTERIELPLDMGVIDMQMLDCPVEPCSEESPCSVTLDNEMRVALIPPGEVVAEINTKSDSGSPGVCIGIKVIS